MTDSPKLISSACSARWLWWLLQNSMKGEGSAARGVSARAATARRGGSAEFELCV